MQKIVMPCTVDMEGKNERAFAEIVYEDGALSIHGVIGPRRSGNCAGFSGQCQDEIRTGTPAKGWDAEMLKRFCNIWDRWHLNNMRPTCEHQRELGWDVLAKEPMVLRHFHLTAEAQKVKKEAQAAALSALRRGKTFRPTKQQTLFAALPYTLDTYGELDKEVMNYYEPRRGTDLGGVGAEEVRIRGWVRFDEHPDGLVCKPCPVCGYEYGSTWQKEPVPQDVIDWLFSLPEAEKKPAWV